VGRCHRIAIEDGAARLVSKKYRRYDKLKQDLSRPPDAIIAGELVCPDEDGKPQFWELIRHRLEPCFLAFDLLCQTAGT
jgi:ATP-dependent DNA ligase